MIKSSNRHLPLSFQQNLQRRIAGSTVISANAHGFQIKIVHSMEVHLPH